MTTKPTAEQLAWLRDIASMTSGGFSTSEHRAALTALLDAYEATQRPIEIDPNAPTDPAALPAFWDARRAALGKGPSVCAAELRRALEHAAAAPASEHVFGVGDVVRVVAHRLGNPHHINRVGTVCNVSADGIELSATNAHASNTFHPRDLVLVRKATP